MIRSEVGTWWHLPATLGESQECCFLQPLESLMGSDRFVPAETRPGHDYSEPVEMLSRLETIDRRSFLDTLALYLRMRAQLDGEVRKEGLSIVSALSWT